MGKSRRNRGGTAHRRDPITKEVKPPSDPELAALREAKILPVIQDLRKADPKARSAAATAIANLVHDTKCRKLLLREQVVHTILTQTLTDAALESRAAGWGILQLLAQEEEPDFCIGLFRQDVLTALEYAAKTILERLQSKSPSFSSLPKAERSFITSIAASLVSLLTALAEASDDILEAAAANSVLSQLLLHLIAHPRQGDDDSVANLRTDALACLMMLCEDNVSLASRMTSPEGSVCFQTMMALKDNTDSDGLLACAALHNIFTTLSASDDSSIILGADDSALVPTLTKAITKALPLEAASFNGDGWSSPFEQYQLALETLASIGTTMINSVSDSTAQQKDQPSAPVDDEDMGDANGPDSEGEEADAPEAEEDEDDEEMGEDEMMADMEMVTGPDDEPETANDLPVLKALLQSALPQLIRLAGPKAEGGEAGDKLQSLALAALNNIAWSISVLDFSDDENASIQRAWQPVGQALWQKVISPILSTDTADVGLATQVTGLAWAVSRSLGGQAPLGSDEHRKFISLYQATKGLPPLEADDPFQSLGVKCVGVLGQLALDPAPVELNREIGAFLVALVEALPETPAADAVEALNQVFDIYGDEAHACDAAVFWKDGLLARLEAVVPKARAMAKGINKKAGAELKTRAHEAVMNLDRFLTYKKKHQSV